MGFLVSASFLIWPGVTVDGWFLAGDHQLQRAAVAPEPAELVEEGHPQGGMLDYLEHHGGQQRADPGCHRGQHHPAPHRAPLERRVRHPQGALHALRVHHVEREEGVSVCCSFIFIWYLCIYVYPCWFTHKGD